ncbi:hypothetical protein JCM5353_001495, partial [Sporobolomyces roseus]
AALEQWSDDQLVRKMEEREVNISVDPTGDADSIVEGYFVEPANVQMPLSKLFSHLQAEEAMGSETSSRPVHYLQSQNGNLADEYKPLLDDVGIEGPAWAREAFGQPPDVANIWIGGGRSKTSMHKDPYENIYLVVRGSKEFVLLPPSEAYCLHERLYSHASWSFSPSMSSFTLVPSSPPLTLPWIPIDPLSPDLSKHPRYSLARPMKVKLNKGDMLYLPAMWFHHVSQTPDYFNPQKKEGTKAAIAVNWWTDMKYEGPFWAGLELNRRLLAQLDGREEEEEEDEEERN